MLVHLILLTDCYCFCFRAAWLCHADCCFVHTYIPHACTLIRACMHACIYIHTACVHADTCVHACIHTACVHADTCVHACMHTYIPHARTLIRACVRAYIPHACTLMRACMHTYIHTACVHAAENALVQAAFRLKLEKRHTKKHAFHPKDFSAQIG